MALTVLWAPNGFGDYEAEPLHLLPSDARALKGKNADCLCMAMDLLTLLLQKDR